MRLHLLGLVLGLVSFVSALSATGSTLLVIIEDDVDKTKYSQFWKDLQRRGYQIDYRSPKDSSLSLFTHGVPAASHLLLFPTKAKGLGPALTPNLLVDFVNRGSNILVALSAENVIPSSVSSLLAELNIALSPDRNSLVVDHWNYDTKSAAEKHDVITVPVTPYSKSKPNVKDYFSVDGVVAFPRAVGQILGNESPLLSSVVKAPSTAYIFNPKDDGESEDLIATGSQINLVSAFQARNSARVTVLGSVEALEDKWFTASVQRPASKKSETTGNRAFAHSLSEWAFKESGVLKVGQIKHFLNEGKQRGILNTTGVPGIDLNPSIYRIKNDVHYSIEVSEWDGDQWSPFVLPGGDQIQLEVSMLSPFHRVNLKPTGRTAEATVFTADFKLPDQHGIFNFLVEHRRPFLTNVEEKRTVTVRHFAHDEWPRSFVITGAYPWISGIWVTIVGWLVFVVMWLYSKPVQEKKNLKR